MELFSRVFAIIIAIALWSCGPTQVTSPPETNTPGATPVEPIFSTADFPTATPIEGTIYRTGWPELPVEAASENLHYVHHLTDLAGVRNFTACYDRTKMCPVWVAAPLHASYAVKNVKRTDDYEDDPQLPFQQVKKWSGYTRGHLLRSASRLMTRHANDQLFYHSNIAPQVQTYFNAGGGAWNRLEEWIDDQYLDSTDTLYQVVGCYWLDARTVVSKTTIPTHYWVALMQPDGDCVGIVVEHREYTENMNPLRPSEYAAVIPITELERFTGERFFVNVPEAQKGEVDLTKWENL